MLQAVAFWLPAAAVATLAAGFFYGEVQHELRSGANDPQVQMAEDAAARLDSGALPEAVLPGNHVELSRSLAPYLMVFDSKGGLVTASLTVDGKPPDYPKGVLDSLHGGESKVTWQTAGGYRSATVAVPYRQGFVVAGRSLREVENRENDAILLAGAAWVAMLGVGAGAALLGAFLTNRP